MATPNIIFIMADDHAAHAISAYGSRVNHTPNLDRIADEGMRLDALLLHELDLHAEPGGDPHRHLQPRQRRLDTDTRSTTACRLVAGLRAAGYRTGVFGKWHLGDGGATSRAASTNGRSSRPGRLLTPR